MDDDATLLRRLSAIEDRLAVKIAERGLQTPDAAGKRILRSNWHLARCRADLFMQMAMEAESGLPLAGKACANDEG
jgi:hypothetical protein